MVLRPLSSFGFSRIEDKKDDRGNDMYVEEVINNSSIYFRVYDNHLIAESHLPKEQLTPMDFTGGSVGVAVTSTEVNAGWDDFANKDKVDVRLLINAF